METLADEIVARAADDWMSADEVIAVVRASGVQDPVNLRDLSVGLVGRLIAEGFVVPGDVDAGGHHPWDLSTADAILKIIREWGAKEDPFVMPGEIFWLDATRKGEEAGREFWADVPEG